MRSYSFLFQILILTFAVSITVSCSHFQEVRIAKPVTRKNQELSRVSFRDDIAFEAAQMLTDIGTSKIKFELPRKAPIEDFKNLRVQIAKPEEAPILFDLPLTYNAQVKEWIKYYQTTGRGWFRNGLQRAYRYLPMIQDVLDQNNLPKDLAYMAMIESGFSSQATSQASAVGPWQFISETGRRYGLHINWWLDERRDFFKSTVAASKYLSFLYDKFGSWYLAAASYNTGEARIERLVRRHQSRNFWHIAKTGGLVEETQNYVPKLIAAMLIAKAPALYGFREVETPITQNTELFYAPGGTDLNALADYLGVTRKSMRDMNTELIRGYIPSSVRGHYIRIPKGALAQMAGFINQTFAQAN